jgi:acyl-CoA reductase-like NAD-dependent aldehyde dehydrogenase
MPQPLEFLAEPAGVPRARQMLQQAQWAARAFAGYDRAGVLRIAEAVAEAAHAKARHYAEWAVRETGFGVVEHKVIKNEACSRGIFQTYRDTDLVSPRVDAERKLVAVPRPAGVVLALTPSTNPVATTYFKTMLALLTRNAIVISPHPMAKECCADAARTMAAAAVAAGAPQGVIQVVDEPSVPLINALMTDERTSVIVATGGTPVVRSAYSSGNPAIGVGPGNVPVLVDASADLAATAKRIVASKAFDNSVLCTNESVLIVEDGVADRLIAAMKREGALLLDEAGAQRLREYMFPGGQLNTEVVGKPAAWIAERAGLRAGARTTVLLAPFDLVVPEEPLAHEKLSPVLGVVRVPSAARGIDAARAVVRIAGAGHSAAIHSTDPNTVMAYAASVPVLRVSVNVGNSTGSSGLDTNLAPTMTVGTGFVGRSSLGANLEPKHLVDWAQIAYNADPHEVMPNFTGIVPWAAPRGEVPPYPAASNAHGATPAAPQATTPPPARSDLTGTAAADELREQVRRLIVEELSHFVKR